MGKILKWFPLNKKMEKGNIKSLIKTLLKYIGVWLIGGIIAVLLSGIPLINSFAENVFSLYGWYMRIGLVLACIQCFFMKRVIHRNIISGRLLWQIFKIVPFNGNIRFL